LFQQPASKKTTTTTKTGRFAIFQEVTAMYVIETSKIPKDTHYIHIHSDAQYILTKRAYTYRHTIHT